MPLCLVHLPNVHTGFLLDQSADLSVRQHLAERALLGFEVLLLSSSCRLDEDSAAAADAQVDRSDWRVDVLVGVCEFGQRKGDLLRHLRSRSSFLRT